MDPLRLSSRAMTVYGESDHLSCCQHPAPALSGSLAWRCASA